MLLNLSPVASISEAQLDAGKRALVRDSAWASLTGAWSGGVVLVAFALSLGAGPMTIGMLAAIPFMAQAVQLPTIFLVERIRKRKLIGVTALNIARTAICLPALLPFFAPAHLKLPLLLLAQVAIALMGSVAACSINSWFHQMIPPAGLGAFFGKRLLIASTLACGATLTAGMLVDNPPFGVPGYAFAAAFIGAGIAGFVSSGWLARTPEPAMPPAGPIMPIRDMLREPLGDANFRSLMFMLGGWNLASNLVAPLLTVYLIQQLGFSFSTVTSL